MTFSREDRRTKLTVRIDDELDERLDSYVEKGGADNRSPAHLGDPTPL